MSHTYSKQTRNLLAFGSDYFFFAMSLGFLDVNVILPSFSDRLGAPPVLVGALSTLFFLSWSFPQLFAGNFIARQPRKKPALVRIALLGRPFVLFMAAFIWLTGASPAWLNLLALCVGFAIFFGSDAFAAVAWFDILGRAFPQEKRGGYISIWQIGKGLGLLGVTALVKHILGKYSFPNNYALLFTGGGFALMVSWIALTLIYEPPASEGESTETRIAWRDFGSHLVRLWREDTRLRLISITRVIFSLSTMAYPFYVLYATDRLQFPEQTLSLFILAQTIGALLASVVLGRVADRFGTHRVLQIGTVVIMVAPVLALVFVTTGGSLSPLFRDAYGRYAYAWIYVCIGLSANLGMLGYINYALDISPPNQRTIYMGFTNAINSIGVFGPILGGWILSQTSYGVLFAVSLTLMVVTLALTLRLPSTRTTEQQSQPPVRYASD